MAALLTFDQLDEQELNEYCAAMENITSLSSTDHDLLIRLTVLAEISQREVGEIRSAQGSHASAIDTRLRAIDTALEKKADRSAVEQLQQFRWTVLGGAAVIAAAVEVVFHFFKS